VGGKDGRRRCSVTTWRRRLICTHAKPSATSAVLPSRFFG